MIVRCRRPALLVAAAMIAIGSPAAGQAVGTLSIGASSAEYDGFLRSGAFVVSPALRFDSHRFSFASQTSWTRFESGSNVTQGNLAAGWSGQPSRRVRIELFGAAGASKYADEPGTGHLLAGGRFHLGGQQAGGWLGATAGRTVGDGTVTPRDISIAAWATRHHVSVVGTATGTWVGWQRYLDLVGAVRWTNAAAQVEARFGVRSWVQSLQRIGDAVPGSYGEVAAILPVSNRLALSLGGGSFPADPARRTLSAKYLSAGIRLRAFGPGAPRPSLLTSMAVQTRLGFGDGTPQIEVRGSGDERTIRVRVTGARSVELMGDFTDWSIVALRQVAAGIWEVSLPMAVGVHRVNLRIDGGAWAAPGGGRVEQTEFGGSVALLVVP